MKTRNFSKGKTSFSPADLLTIQKESWQRFWRDDLKEIISEVSPIQDYTNKKLELHLLDFYLDKPKYKTGDEAMENNASFEASLKIKTRLLNIKTKEAKEQDVLLANFPLMTERGTFIINGIERVTISQLIRSPGVFFVSRSVAGKEQFGAKIIPNRGAWLEFETDSTSFIGVKIDRKRRIPATTFLRALGFATTKEIKELFKDVDKGEVRFIDKTIAREGARTQDEALLEVHSRLRPGEMATPEMAKELFNNMFFNFKRYDLSRVGRWKTWQRLPELKPKKAKILPRDRVLNIDDIVATLKEIIRLNNDPNAKPDQIDHLGNRRVRVFTEILANRIKVGIARTERIAKDRMAALDIATVIPSQIINPRPIIAQVQSFFASSQMSQFMDNENPLSELEHKRRLAATGPGGLTRERAGFEARDVQPSHYGRICPIQTPEGQNVGLINYLSSFARINDYGFIETPYFRVKNGRVTDEVKYLNAYEEEQYTIGSGLIPVDSSGKITADRVEARIKEKPTVVRKEKLDFMDVSPEQCLSAATSCIPFLQNDDANRALMGSNMQRQAIPLVNPEPPLVMTGMEKKIAFDSGQEIIAQESGRVIGVDAQHVRLKIKGLKGKAEEKNYIFESFIKTNKDGCFQQKVVVKRGQKIQKGDVLVEGGSIAENRLALGKNLMIAIMPWRGANFEDAVIVSEKLLKDDTFTSIKLKSFSCKVRETKLGPEITTWDIPNVGEEKLKNLDEEGIVRTGAEVGSKDVLVGKISPREKEALTAEERLLKAIFGEKARDVRDTSLTMKYGERGKVMDIKVFSRKKGHRLDPGVIKQVDVSVASLRALNAGDKLANRHGNKGVVTKILQEEDMPFMEDGTPVDIIINPTGVVKRMNLGQVFETHLGFAVHKLGYHAITPSLSGATIEDIKEELKKAGLPKTGKVRLFDGITGQPFSQDVTVGYMYVMKLDHMAEDKIHMRSIGPYSLITQQPLGGKAQFGGQRFGEMEVWALEGYGAAYTLQEMLTIKSDDVVGRAAAYKAILGGEKIPIPTVPSSFNLLINELKSLALDVIIEGKDE